MGLTELLLLAVGLSMDAFAVSICKGLKMRKINYKHACIIGLFFGGFQALMPLIGWALGRQFSSYIESVDHWIAFGLLLFIGGKMAIEAIKEKDEEDGGNSDDLQKLDIKELFILAIATSIDALAVGITFACVPVAILPSGVTANTIFAAAVIGVTTFLLSVLGVRIGNVFGTKYKNKAEFAGGVILILLGVKIILEHFGIISF